MNKDLIDAFTRAVKLGHRDPLDLLKEANYIPESVKSVKDPKFKEAYDNLSKDEQMRVIALGERVRGV